MKKKIKKTQEKLVQTNRKRNKNPENRYIMGNHP